MNSNIITKRREDKSQTFQYLKALLIIMVIDDHRLCETFSVKVL